MALVGYAGRVPMKRASDLSRLERGLVCHLSQGVPRAVHAHRGGSAGPSLSTAGRNDLAAEARQRYLDVQVAQALAASVATSVERVEGLSRVVEERHRAGHASRYDVTRMQLELARLRTARDQHLADAEQAALRLGALLGIQGWAPRAATPLETGPAVAMTLVSVDARPPAVIAAERAREAAVATVARARSERWPDLRVMAGTTLGHEAYASELIVGVGLDVPIFDFGEGPVAEARAEVIAADALLAATTREHDALLEAGRRDVVRRRAALAELDATITAQMDELATMAEVAYRGGQATLLDLFDGVERGLDARELRITLIAAVRSAEIAWLHAAGRIWDAD